MREVDKLEGVKIVLYDTEIEKIFKDADGDIVSFDSTLEAKNFLFIEQYKEEYVNKNILFLAMLEK